MLCDLFCRSVFFPSIALKHDFFSDEVLMQFDAADDESYGLSVASRCMLVDEAGAHGYGCRTSDKKNERFERENGRKPNPEDEQRFYVGFYDLRPAYFSHIKLDHYSMSLRWVPEEGEDAHFEVRLDRVAGDFTDKKLKRDRKLARQLLSMCLIGPHRHVCEADKSKAATLDAVFLPALVERTLVR